MKALSRLRVPPGSGAGLPIPNLTNQAFLERIIHGHLLRLRQESGGIDQGAVLVQIQALMSKRKRVLDLYIAEDITAAEKAERLDAIDKQIVRLKQLQSVRPANVMDAGRIVNAIVPLFRQWGFLSMDHKRELLGKLLPEIFVNAYNVSGATLRLDGCNNDGPHPIADTVTTRIYIPEYRVFVPFTELGVA